MSGPVEASAVALLTIGTLIALLIYKIQTAAVAVVCRRWMHSGASEARKIIGMCPATHFHQSSVCKRRDSLSEKIRYVVVSSNFQSADPKIFNDIGTPASGQALRLSRVAKLAGQSGKQH